MSKRSDSDRLKGPLLSDLDGTIADTAAVIFSSLRATCEEFSVEVAANADLSWSLGPPLNYCLRRLGIAEDDLAPAIEMFEKAHVDSIDLVTPIPGADLVIRELASEGIEIGVATIKPQPAAELVLDRLGLSEHITFLKGREDDMDPSTKTDLLRQVRAVLTGPGPVYVGDHDNDEAAARDLGIPFFRYPESDWGTVRRAVLGLAAHEAR